MRKTKGITLIALVITIIVLLILAGISIATLTEQNGVLTKASTAREENKKAEYKEILELIGNGLRPEKVLESLSTKNFMDRYEEAIRDKTVTKEILEGAIVERKSDEKIWVTTVEGYIYEITEEKVTLLGKKGENTPPDLKVTDLEFKLVPEGYTNQNITVEIIAKVNIEGFTLQYSIDDAKNWIDYKAPIIIEENVTIYAKLVNNIGEEGAVTTKEIDGIDRETPNKATITFNKNSLSSEEELTATVIQSDIGTSGIDITNCRYVFTSSETEIGTTIPTDFTGGNFSDETQTLTLNSTTVGTYYLHVLTVDRAGNRTETISKPVTIKDTIIPNEAQITFNKTSIASGDTVTATVTQSDSQSGVEIKNCKYIFTNNNKAIGTSDISKYSGGGFTKETNDKITFKSTASGTYYLHVLTVDKAGNKRETISSGIEVQAFSSILVSNGTVVNSNYGYTSTGWMPSFSVGSGTLYLNTTNYNERQAFSGIYWRVQNVGSATKMIVEAASGSSNSNAEWMIYYSSAPATAQGGVEWSYRR